MERALLLGEGRGEFLEGAVGDGVSPEKIEDLPELVFTAQVGVGVGGDLVAH